MLLILTVAFIGGSLCVREDAHLNLMFFVARIPVSWKRAVELLVVLIMLGFGVALLTGGIKTTLQVWSVRDPTLPVSRGSYYVPLAVGGLLIALFQVERLISALRG
jgi:TRAP-type C4-dicarboxylate transport system permease small subunit